MSKLLFGFNFLHRHPKLETINNIDSEHIIVDRLDWELTVNFLTNLHSSYPQLILLLEKEKENIVQKSSDSWSEFKEKFNIPPTQIDLTKWRNCSNCQHCKELGLWDYECGVDKEVRFPDPEKHSCSKHKLSSKIMDQFREELSKPSNVPFINSIQGLMEEECQHIWTTLYPVGRERNPLGTVEAVCSKCGKTGREDPERPKFPEDRSTKNREG